MLEPSGHFHIFSIPISIQSAANCFSLSFFSMFVSFADNNGATVRMHMNCHYVTDESRALVVSCEVFRRWVEAEDEEEDE